MGGISFPCDVQPDAWLSKQRKYSKIRSRVNYLKRPINRVNGPNFQAVFPAEFHIAHGLTSLIYRLISVDDIACRQA
jgi:hypothetical protein